VAAAHGVAVTGFAVDLLARMLGDGIVTNKQDGACGVETLEEESQQEVRQLQARPVRLGEDAVVTGRSPSDTTSNGTQEVTDSASAGGEDSGNGKEMDASEDGTGEGSLEEGEDRQSVVGYAGHGASWLLYPDCLLTVMIRHWRPLFFPLRHGQSLSSTINGHYRSLEKSSSETVPVVSEVPSLHS